MLGKEFQSVRYLECGLGEMHELCVGLFPWPRVEGASPGGLVRGSPKGRSPFPGLRMALAWLRESPCSKGLAGVAQWIEHQPANESSLVGFPVGARAWVMGQVPMWGHVRGS